MLRTWTWEGWTMVWTMVWTLVRPEIDAGMNVSGIKCPALTQEEEQDGREEECGCAGWNN